MTKPNLTQQEVLRVQKNAAKAPAFLAFTTRPLLSSSVGVQEQEARAQRSSTAARLRMSQQLPRCATNQFGQRHFSSVLPRCAERVSKRLEIVRSFKSAVYLIYRCTEVPTVHNKKKCKEKFKTVNYRYVLLKEYNFCV